MMYVIDVVGRGAASDYPARWLDWARELHERYAMQTAELFELSENIRNADYDFLSVCSFATVHDCEVALRANPAVASQHAAVERTRCRLQTQLAQPTEHLDTHVWLINPFEVSAEQVPEVLDMWDRAKDVMVAHPGFLNARLFKACSSLSKYGLINVAKWRSAEEFKQALGGKAYDRHRERSLNYRLHPSLCRRVQALERSLEPAGPGTHNQPPPSGGPQRAMPTEES